MNKSPLKVVTTFYLTIPLTNFYSAKVGGSIEGEVDKEEDNIKKFDCLYQQLRDKVLLELSTLKTSFNKVEDNDR